jgi:uncharacterized membrane protein HdeD (DUF308 family)
MMMTFTCNWWTLVLRGIFTILFGLMAFVWPTTTVAALLTIMATWVILTGFLEIVTTIRLRHEIENEWLLGLGWLASLILAVFLTIWPGSGLVALTWLFGAYALAFGILMLMFGLRLHLLH